MAVFTIGSSTIAGGGGGGGLSPSADETITGYWTFQNATDTVLTVQAGSAQGSYLQQWLDNAGNPLAYITNSAEIHGGLFATEGSNSGMQYNKRSDGSAAYTMYSDSGEMSFYSFTAGGNAVRFLGNGNALFGSDSDGNYRLDVSKSGSAGTARFYDQTATTGSTLVTISRGAGQSNTSNVLAIDGTLKFGGQNTTGAGSAALSNNCPATTATAPYTWIRAVSSDGSTVYIPCWK